MSRLALAFILGFVLSFAYVSTSQAATIVCPNGPYDPLNSAWNCNGTNSADDITAYAGGWDFVYGKDGQDVILAGNNAEDIDRIYGQGGGDTIYADDPGDYVQMPNSLPGIYWFDHIYCGGGTDTVYLDHADQTDGTCERLVYDTVP